MSDTHPTSEDQRNVLTAWWKAGWQRNWDTIDTETQLYVLAETVANLQHCIDRVTRVLCLPVYLPGDLVTHTVNPGRRLIVLGTDEDRVTVRSADFEGGIVEQAHVDDLHRWTE